MELKLTQEWQTLIDLLCQKFQHTQYAQPGLSLSIKTAWQSYTNQEEPLLLFAQVDWSTGALPAPSQWTAYRLNSLRDLIAAGSINPTLINAALSSCTAGGTVSQISPAVLLHAAAYGVVTCFTQPLSLLAEFYERDREENLNEWLGDRVQIYPFLSSLHQLSKLIAASVNGPKSSILINRGLLVTSDGLDSCLNEQEHIVNRIESCFEKSAPSNVSNLFSEAPLEILPRLRRNLSRKAGFPLVVHLDQSMQTAAVLDDLDKVTADLQTVWLPDFAARCGLLSRQDIEAEIETNILSNCPAWEDFLPGYVFSPGLGMLATGRSAAEANRTAQVALTYAAVIRQFKHSEPMERLPEPEYHEALQWQAASLHTRQIFSGEIALVTGAASGIGKACAASLLARGAAVVGLDINPQIVHTFDHPSYYGFVCDLTKEAEIQAAMLHTIKRFGGLDMLVLNAGLFPSGCHIQAISLADYTRVISVNQFANLVLMREAYPLLKYAPLYGRVVVVGSRNLKAPGPGAVAYSTSKAALTQMARVAAMEWAQDGIRVNVIHPDSVFDTGIYTEEVLQARAAHYGVTVDQYKKRNLLKTEIMSRDVGEMVAEMCGPVFRAVTGTQIQLDGGNERTI